MSEASEAGELIESGDLSDAGEYGEPIEVELGDDMLFRPNRYAPNKYRRRRLTKKQQKFVQLYVHNDLTNTECAHRAGYSHPSQVASVLLNQTKFLHVQETIKELQEGYQKKYEISFEKTARDLQMIRDAAVEEGKYSAAVQAELGRAKLGGLLIEKKEIKHGFIDQMDRSEVEARLRKLIETNQLAPELQDRVLAPEHEENAALEDVEEHQHLQDEEDEDEGQGEELHDEEDLEGDLDPNEESLV